LYLIAKVACNAPRIIDKFLFWFMPIVWRPEGFEEKYPVEKNHEAYNFKKYKTELPKPLFTLEYCSIICNIGIHFSLVFFYRGYKNSKCFYLWLLYSVHNLLFHLFNGQKSLELDTFETKLI
jgi:hypothetical protein